MKSTTATTARAGSSSVMTANFMITKFSLPAYLATQMELFNISANSLPASWTRSMFFAETSPDRLFSMRLLN